jgi:hypothetical protein
MGRDPSAETARRKSADMKRRGQNQAARAVLAMKG